jgi:hypothetical protein
VLDLALPSTRRVGFKLRCKTGPSGRRQLV